MIDEFGEATWVNQKEPEQMKGKKLLDVSTDNPSFEDVMIAIIQDRRPEFIKVVNDER